jgi:hypothetical protein
MISMENYFIECISAFNLKFGGGVGINPETERQEIVIGRVTQTEKRTNQAMSFTGVPLTFAL